jgi:predicted DNA-binding protein
MPETAVISIRLPKEDAERFEEQAKSRGMTRSLAAAALIEAHVAVAQKNESPDG